VQCFLGGVWYVFVRVDCVLEVVQYLDFVGLHDCVVGCGSGEQYCDVVFVH